jgi:hypothetical protein
MLQRITAILIAKFAAILAAILAIIAFSACSVQSGGRVIGGQPVDISELATYPGSVELSAGESKIIDPIFAPAQHETPPVIGLGIQVIKTQRNFRVPSDTTFDQIKAFYSDKLLAGGWREDPAMRVFTSSANQQMQNMQGAIWVRVDQTLLIVLARDPASGNKELSLSLATH